MNISPEQLREIALRAADSVCAPYLNDSSLQRYAALLFAEFQKLQADQERPAAYIHRTKTIGHQLAFAGDVSIYGDPNPTPLYAAPPIPFGMVLVPIEPTEEMLAAGSSAWDIGSSGIGVFKAMLAAAGEKP